MVSPYYQDEYVTIYNKDCRDMTDVTDKGIDLVLTDPPYNIMAIGRAGNFDKMANDDTSTIQFRQLITSFLLESCFKLLPDRYLLMFGGWQTAYVVRPLLAENFSIFGQIVWVKNNYGLGFHLRHQYEIVWVCARGKPVFPEPAPSDVWFADRLPKLQHIAQKPTELLDVAILLFGTGGTVLDPFLGSGSTAVSAKRLNRRCIGYEIEEKYCEIAANRCRQMVMELKI